MVVALPLVASTCVALVVGPGGADVQMTGGLAGASRVPHPAGGRGAMPTQRTARQQLQMNFGGHGKPPGSEATNSGAQNRRGAQGAARAESKGLTIGPGGDYVFAGFTDFTKRDEEHVPVHMRGGLTWPGLDVPPGSPLSPPGSEHGDRMGVQTGTHAAATARYNTIRTWSTLASPEAPAAAPAAPAAGRRPLPRCRAATTGPGTGTPTEVAPVGTPTAWSVEDVCAFIQGLEMPAAVVSAFRENAVDGDMLLSLSDADIEEELGMLKLQIRKLRRELGKVQ